MNKRPFLAISFLVLTSTASAQTPVFTSLNSNGKEIYAGVKVEKKGLEPDTYLIKVSDSLKFEKLSLPQQLIHREIVAILPTADKSLVVLTQRTVEQGDDPLIHKFDPSKKEWKQLGEVKCPSFAKLKVESSSIGLLCLETNEKGEEVESLKKVPISGIKLKPAEVTLPLTKIEDKDLKAELIGDTFEWKKLKVNFNKKEKIFSP